MRRRGTQIGLFALGGWLFADMMLALSVLFIASSSFALPESTSTPTVTPTPTLSPTPSHTATVTQTPTVPPTLTPTPSPTVTPTPTPTPEPTHTPPPTPCAVTVSPSRIKEEFDGGSGPQGDPSPEVLRERFAQYSGSQAGIVITFGRGGQSVGEARAARVNGVLRQQLPEIFTGRTTMEGFFSTLPGTGAEVWVYMLVSTC